MSQPFQDQPVDQDKELDAIIERRIEIAKDATDSNDPVVQIAWLAQGIDVWHRTNGKRGHSPNQARSYIISSVTRLLDAHTKQAIFNELQQLARDHWQVPIPEQAILDRLKYYKKQLDKGE